MYDLLAEGSESLRKTTPWEYIGGCAGIVSVWFVKKNNIMAYPIGLVNITIYVFLCYQIRLYADMGIHVYYFFMSLYGWHNWQRIQKKKAPTVSFASTRERQISVLLLLSSFFAIYGILQYTDTDVPTWDASSTALAVVAMWLMTKKKIEHWGCWIASDLIALPLYASKGYLFTAVQYIFFLFFATGGLIGWVRLQRQANKSAQIS